MSTRIRVETQSKRDDLFRFGQDFTSDKVQFVLNRSPYANFLTHGIISDALGKGFEIVDKDGEKVDWNEEIQKVIESMWKMVLLAGKYERGFGKSLLQVFAGEDKGLVLRAFRKYDAKYSKAGSLESAETIEQLVDGQTLYHTHEKFKKEFAYEIINRPTDKIGEGRSFIEPIWDQIYSMSVLDANATYFAVRIGGGLKVLKVPQAKLKDAGYVAHIKEMLQSVDSANSTITLPIISGTDAKVQPDLEIKSGSQIDFIQIRDLLLGSISVATGIPREVLLGSELGLRSSETNQSAYFSVLQAIQREYVPIIRWLVNVIREHLGIGDENFQIDWNEREEVTEESLLQSLKMKTDIIKVLMEKGFAVESILKLVELEQLEIDQEEIDRKQAIADQIAGGNNAEEENSEEEDMEEQEDSEEV